MNDTGLSIIFINGIMSSAESPKEWNKLAAAEVEYRGVGAGLEFSYSCEIIGGEVYRSREAQELATVLLDNRRTYEANVAAGHSDGGPMTCIAARLAREQDAAFYLDQAHLIAAAMPPDCDLNGMNALAESGAVKQFFLYVSPDDEVLGLPLLSYGRCGKDGPTNISPKLQSVLTIVYGTCSHCGWVGELFESTVGNVIDMAVGVTK